MYDKQALMALVRQKALKFGQFTLASGKKASYYLDGKQVTLDPPGPGWWPRESWTCWAAGRCRRPSAACRSAPIRSPPPW